MIFRRIPYFLPEDGRQGGGAEASSGEEQPLKEAAPGIPIVRSNTPKPLSLGAAPRSVSSSHWTRPEEVPELAAFPALAPSAPPLPEESERVPISETSTPLPVRPSLSTREPQEFLWIFEYGLEMDPAILNSVERLDGLALLYGSAMLKGYCIAIRAIKVPGSDYSEQIVVTIVPAHETGSEVWGVLYRVPRRVTEPLGDEPSLLDTVHAAVPPRGLFKSIQIVVRETYRDHDVSDVITYIASDALLEQMSRRIEPQAIDLMLERLIAIARRQKLPEIYVHALSTRLSPWGTAPAASRTSALPAATMELDADPSIALVGQEQPDHVTKQEQSDRVNTLKSPVAMPRTNRWLMAFAVYLVCLLVVMLIFAVFAGSSIGSNLFSASFTLLHVPWLVLVYGLLGACISCIATLGHAQALNPPNFIVVTWFARPYIGAILALFAYLLLNSGLFVLGGNGDMRSTLFMLAGALAGICENRLFMQRRIL